MLFNSGTFLFVFLPVTLAIFYLANRLNRTLGKLVLIVASLVFYGYWNPANLPILLGSTLVNYVLGLLIVREIELDAPAWRRRAILMVGLVGNVMLLGFFKYTGFAIQTIDKAFSLSYAIPDIVLPLGISFFTFQKIAFLVDVHDGQVGKVSFLDYCLFVFFFPQLISGPIVHHREIIPQLEKQSFGVHETSASIGFALLVLGLAKKVLIADNLAPAATEGFQAVALGHPIGAAAAWVATLSATLQIYFDFSGYSDMAIGLGRIFGIVLPFNFNSPFKATNSVDFWSRWHMSLTRFLTAYIYNPIVLRESRRWAAKGRALPKRGQTSLGAYAVLVAFPTVATMTIAGVWHGAGFQFAIFGLLNGLFMAVCHGWRLLKQALGWKHEGHLVTGLSILATFLAFVITIAFFSAPNEKVGAAMVADMFGAKGPGTNVAALSYQMLAIAVLLAFVWLLPNSQEIVGLLPRPEGKDQELSLLGRFDRWIVWKPSFRWALVMGTLCLASVIGIAVGRESPFLYFQF